MHADSADGRIRSRHLRRLFHKIQPSYFYGSNNADTIISWPWPHLRRGRNLLTTISRVPMYTIQEVHFLYPSAAPVNDNYHTGTWVGVEVLVARVFKMFQS